MGEHFRDNPFYAAFDTVGIICAAGIVNIYEKIPSEINDYMGRIAVSGVLLALATKRAHDFYDQVKDRGKSE